MIAKLLIFHNHMVMRSLLEMEFKFGTNIA
jgi:hypothetical protein